MSSLKVAFQMLTQDGQHFMSPRKENGHGSSASTPSFVRDTYAECESLADQTAGLIAMEFSFSAPVQLLYVRGKTAEGLSECRVQTSGGLPAANVGIPCDDGVATAIPVETQLVKVYAPEGMQVSVWGFRY